MFSWNQVGFCQFAFLNTSDYITNQAAE
jgi:hypothetical protein